MEKPPTESQQPHSQQLPAQPIPPPIHRKPLPSNNTTISIPVPTATATSRPITSTDPEKKEPETYISITETTPTTPPLPSPPSHPYPESQSQPHSRTQSHANLALFPPLTPSDSYHQDQKRTLNHHHPFNNPDAAKLPPLPRKRNNIVLQRLRTKWLFLRKRTRYMIIGAIAAVLILIIGLAAGLSVRSSNKFTNLPLPNSHGGPYTGDLTYYDPDVGACGMTSTGKDFIVAVSHYVFDAVQSGSDPNTNPLCGKKIRANRAGKSVDLTVVDRCTGCQPKDIDVTRTVFEGLANIDQGRVPVTWAWLEDVPNSATNSQ